MRSSFETLAYTKMAVSVETVSELSRPLLLRPPMAADGHAIRYKSRVWADECFVEVGVPRRNRLHLVLLMERTYVASEMAMWARRAFGLEEVRLSHVRGAHRMLDWLELAGSTYKSAPHPRLLTVGVLRR